MNETNLNRIVTLKDIWDVFVRRIPIILLAAVIAAGGFFAFDRLTYEPLYSSTATLYITRDRTDNVTTSGEAYNDFTLALKVVYDCNYLLKSRTVLNQIIEEMDLDMTYAQLYSHISTNNPYNTRILEVTVTAETPDLAKQIVDRICVLGQQKIEDAMGFSQVNLYEYGTHSPIPSNQSSALLTLIAGVAAAVVTYAVFLVIFLLDDRIRSAEDVERLLELSILAEIPDANGTHKSHYGYYRAPYAAKTRRSKGGNDAKRSS